MSICKVAFSKMLMTNAGFHTLEQIEKNRLFRHIKLNLSNKGDKFIYSVLPIFQQNIMVS